MHILFPLAFPFQKVLYTLIFSFIAVVAEILSGTVLQGIAVLYAQKYADLSMTSFLNC